MASSDHATATTDHSTAVIDHSTASADHTAALADQEIVDGLQDQFNDVIANATVDSEVINARQGSATLSQNILSIKGQLAEKTSQKKSLDKEMRKLTTTQDQKVIVSDNFLRGTSASLGTADTGQAWEMLGGTFGIDSNHAAPSSAGAWSKAVVSSGVSDCEISLVFYSWPPQPRLLFRVVDTNNYWFFGWTAADKLSLYKIVAGVVTSLGAYTSVLSKSVGSVFKVVLSGSSIKCYINNFLALQASDATFATATKHGITGYGQAAGFNKFKIKETIKPIYPNNLIASVDNMLVAYDGSNLFLSTDGGHSYSKGFSIENIEIIKYVHLFSNGNILFADHLKCYYSHDWLGYRESTLLAQDNSPFVPYSLKDNFSCYKKGSVKQLVGGVEMLVWGNYSTASESEFNDFTKVWYTKDFGVTVKKAYNFNTPTTLKCRHIHNVDFNPSDSSFWIQTGDENDYFGTVMTHWLKGTYDLITDAWTFTDFASGIAFKSTNMIFKEPYVYFSNDNYPNGGIKRAPIATMGDSATHTTVLTTPKSCHFMLIGPSGDIVAFQTREGGAEMPRTMYYAPDGINFVRIVGSMPYIFDSGANSQYQNYWPINSNGKILAGIQNQDTQNIILWDKTPSVFVDDFIRENGFPNAFK